MINQWVCGRGSMVGLAMLVMLIGGCTSSKPAAPESTLRPIDRVREGIVSVRDQLRTTLASAETLTAPSTDMRTARSTFTRELRSTEAQVQQLRADAVELRERASDYLALWGGKISTVSVEGRVTTVQNPTREQAKTNYDQMVQSLQQARDIVLPLLSDFQKLELRLRDNLSAADRQALAPDIQRAQTQGNSGIALLDTAVQRLDEVKKLVGGANPSMQQNP